jgi:hypothetical protein
VKIVEQDENSYLADPLDCLSALLPDARKLTVMNATARGGYE